MTQERLIEIFADANARTFTDEKRRKAEEDIRIAQKLGDDPMSSLVAKINVELILQKTLLLEILSAALVDEE